MEVFNQFQNLEYTFWVLLNCLFVQINTCSGVLDLRQNVYENLMLFSMLFWIALITLALFLILHLVSRVSIQNVSVTSSVSVRLSMGTRVPGYRVPGTRVPRQETGRILS